ncbi:hypothetical protein [Halocatena pleomorpha]|uniref:DUF7979 domain-containing protein n=1 Tax=Halocatena pleomorpha TaxID=1785090 RepID=A0A3P3RL64_9EURY|nr:hypothetical protein [Halocatena pleomorpha]RRJ33610.1 hypothetical protein EIK79_02085 [Halocatena pleomorpha]
MLQKVNWGTAVQAVAIGMLLVGITSASFGLYTGSQSSPYLVQLENESSSVNESVPYENLTSSQKELFDRIVPEQQGSGGGGAASVGGASLQFFANNVVEYNGGYYAFEIQYEGEEGTVQASFVAGGCALFGLGFVVFLLPQFVYRQQTGNSET